MADYEKATILSALKNSQGHKVKTAAVFLSVNLASQLVGDEQSAFIIECMFVFTC